MSKEFRRMCGADQRLVMKAGMDMKHGEERTVVLSTGNEITLMKGL